MSLLSPNKTLLVLRRRLRVFTVYTWASDRLTVAAVVLVDFFALFDSHGDADDVVVDIAVLAPDHDAGGHFLGTQWTLEPRFRNERMVTTNVLDA